MLTPDEADSHPQRNVITRYMEAVEADQNRCMATVMRTEDVKAGDYFLLCTDGVLHCITDDELQQLLLSEKSDEEKMKELADICLDSEDNNTAWLVSVRKVTADSMETDDMSVPNETSVTRRMTMKARCQEEVESIQQSSNNLRKWFNKMFK